MKNTWLRRTKDFKGKVALEELKRAHIIIALLSTSLAFVIISSSIYPIQLDSTLSAVVSALLVIVAGISLSISVAIKTKK